MISSKQKHIEALEVTIEQARLAYRDLETRYLETQDLADAHLMEVKALRRQQMKTSSATDVNALEKQLRRAESTIQQQRYDIDQLQQALSRMTRARKNSEAGFVRLKRKIARLEN